MEYLLGKSCIVKLAKSDPTTSFKTADFSHLFVGMQLIPLNLTMNFDHNSISFFTSTGTLLEPFLGTVLREFIILFRNTLTGLTQKDSKI